MSPPRLPLFSIYRSPVVYRSVMRMLYGAADQARFDAVLARIPRGATVLELCCGPGELGRRLRERGDPAYGGIELHESLCRAARAHHLQIRTGDVLEVGFPRADVVVMMSSLYHFREGAAGLIERMRAAARSEVIITEPVVNLASHRLPWIRALAAHLSDAGYGPEHHRFDETALQALLLAEEVIELAAIAGGRERLVRLRGRGEDP